MTPLLRAIDCVTVPVPDLDAGLAFYRDDLGHRLLWRNDDTGQAGLELPDSETELVLTTGREYAPAWLVRSVDQAVEVIRSAGGQVRAAPADIPVGRLAVVTDPFGNSLALIDLSKGHYVTDPGGVVRGVEG